MTPDKQPKPRSDEDHGRRDADRRDADRRDDASSVPAGGRERERTSQDAGESDEHERAPHVIVDPDDRE